MISHALAVHAWLVEQGIDANPLPLVAMMRHQRLTPLPRAVSVEYIRSRGDHQVLSWGHGLCRRGLQSRAAGASPLLHILGAEHGQAGV